MRTFTKLFGKTILLMLILLSVINTKAQICDTVRGGPKNTVNSGIISSSPNLNDALSTTYFLAEQWTFQGVPGEVRNLLKFDLSGIPAGSVISSAKLNLYADTLSSNGGSSHPMFGADSSYLQRITSQWNDTTVTWSTQPATTTAGEVFLAQSTSPIQNYLNLDVLSFVQAWIDSPARNYGVMIKILTPNYYNSMIFCSGNYPDSTLWPTLLICYAANGISSIDASADNGMSIYPNPNKGNSFHLQSAADMDINNARVIALDMLGREIPLTVTEKKADGITFSLGGDIHSGMYLVGLANAEKQIYRKVLLVE